jgi:alpha-N-arabinofuranosidase
MTRRISRRNFIASAATSSAALLLPKWSVPETNSAKRIVIHADEEIGIVRPELHGHFAEHLGSCTYGGLWVGKKSPIPNIDGYRKQAVEYLRKLGIPVLRWPGGCFADDYHWRDGIGLAAQRPKRVNIHWGNYVEDNSFGTHEFIVLCRLIGAEPYLAGNVGSGSPFELRDWIEYCNYPGGSTLSDERVRNGSAEPFRVRYWGVGNESWGCGGSMRPEYYSDLYREFATYLRSFGDTKLFLIASGPNGNDVQWTRGVLDGFHRGRPDGISMHYYSNGKAAPTAFTADQSAEQLSSFAKIEQAIMQQRALLDGYPNGKDVALILDEWGVWDRIPREDEQRYGRLWQQSTMRSAVAAGLGLNLFNRQADKLYMCNIAQIMNVLQSLLLTDGPEGKRCVRTSTYYAFALFKPHRSNTSVRVETDDSSAFGISASASKGVGLLVVSVVNPSPDFDAPIVCTLRGMQPSSASAQIVHDADLNAANTFDVPDRLTPKTLLVTVDGSSVRFDLPRLSVATITVRTPS